MIRKLPNSFYFFIFFSLFVFFMFVPVVQAAALGVSPGSLKFEGKKEVSYVKQLFVFNSGAEDAIVRIQSDYSWLQSQDSVFVAKQSKQMIPVTVFAQRDLANGNYKGELVLTTSAGLVSPGFVIPVSFNVNDTEIFDVKLGEIFVGQGEAQYGFPVSARIENRGNVAAEVKIRYNLLRSGTLVASVTQDALIQPYSVVINKTWFEGAALAAGNYDLVTELLLLNGSAIASMNQSIKIYPFGSFTRELSVSNLSIDNGVQVEIRGIIRNSGFIASNVYLEAVVFVDDEYVGTYQSQSGFVQPGKEIVHVVVIPGLSGRELTAHVSVVYDGGRTSPEILKFDLVQYAKIKYVGIFIGLCIAMCMMYCLGRRIRQLSSI